MLRDIGRAVVDADRLPGPQLVGHQPAAQGAVDQPAIGRLTADTKIHERSGGLGARQELTGLERRCDRAGDLGRVLLARLGDSEAADREIAELGARRRLDLEIGGGDAGMCSDRLGRGAVHRRMMRGHGRRTLPPIGTARQKAHGFSAVELTPPRAP